MARSNGHRCPHNCARCRAIEAGQGGPYSPSELLDLGLVVFPPETEIERSPELAEAQLKVSLAEIDYGAAQRDLDDIRNAIMRRSTSIPFVVSETGERVEVATSEYVPAVAELDDAFTDAMHHLAEVGKRLQEARRLERSIAHREMDERRLRDITAQRAEFEHRQSERSSDKRNASTLLLERLRGKGGNGNGAA